VNLQTEWYDAHPLPDPVTQVKRSRTAGFNDSAKLLFKASLATWKAASGAPRRAIENSILLQAQLPTAVDLLGAKGWDQKLVSTAMNGLNKRTNEANKKGKSC